MRLQDKVAIVTGGGQGIGREYSLRFAEEGASVAIADLRAEEAKSVESEIEAAGGSALSMRADVADEEGAARMVAETVERFGRVDILVNNAAILVPGSIESVLPRHLDLIWQIDLRGPLLLMRACVPHMKAAGGGHIVNVSSRAGVFPGPGPYPETRSGGGFYAMVKSGLERYSQALAIELQDDGIAVNVLSPLGRIRTPGNIWAENDPENPTLEFEPAPHMARGTVWICEQPPGEFTGHIRFDEDLCAEKGL